jgi:hypothetical protein
MFKHQNLTRELLLPSLTPSIHGFDPHSVSIHRLLLSPTPSPPLPRTISPPHRALMMHRLRWLRPPAIVLRRRIPIHLPRLGRIRRSVLRHAVVPVLLRRRDGFGLFAAAAAEDAVDGQWVSKRYVQGWERLVEGKGVRGFLPE